MKTKLVRRAKAVLKEAEEQHSSIEALKRTGKLLTDDDIDRTEFWVKDTTPEENENSPGLSKVREQLAREFIHAAAATTADPCRMARRLLIVNRRNAKALRTRFNRLLSRRKRNLLGESIEPNLRNMLDELANDHAPHGIIRSIDKTNKVVRWQSRDGKPRETRFTAISTWLSDDKRKQN